MVFGLQKYPAPADYNSSRLKIYYNQVDLNNNYAYPNKCCFM